MKLKELLNESGLSRVWKHTQEHDSGTISAFRSRTDCGDGDKITKKENKNRNGQLKRTLLGLGYGVTAIKGTYIENYGSKNEIEVKEDSYLVVDLKDKGNLEKDLKKLGKKFEQDSITYSVAQKALKEAKGDQAYYLIGTNSCEHGYPGLGTKIKLGKPMFGSKGEFHSKINNRPFIFESIEGDQELLTDYTPNEIRGIKHLAEVFESEEY